MFKNIVKVKVSRYMPWRRLGGEEVKLLLILNLGTRWGWVVSVTPRQRFTPGEITPGTHWRGGWVGPRAGLDAEARRKIPLRTLCWEYLDLRGKKEYVARENYTTRSFIIYTVHQMLLEWSNKDNEIGGACIYLFIYSWFIYRRCQ
jgi:hypothetical protein